MHKRLIVILSLLLCVALLTECSRRKSIPDDTLVDIFHDAYLTNAYLGIRSTRLDSLQIYEPILKRYGYTPSDLRYTIGNFSRRKSAQLGTVLRKVEERLTEEARIYEKRVVVLDTIKNVAVRTFKKTILQNSLIEVKKSADTARLRIVISPLEPGSYTVRYRYTNEEKDKRYHYRATMWVETEHGNRRSNHTFRLTEEDHVRRTFNTDHNATRLILSLGEFEEIKPAKGRKGVKFRRPKLSIRDLEVTYTPTDEYAIDSLYKRHIDIRIFDDEFLTFKADSLAPTADTTRVL